MVDQSIHALFRIFQTLFNSVSELPPESAKAEPPMRTVQQPLIFFGTTRQRWPLAPAAVVLLPVTVLSAKFLCWTLFGRSSFFVKMYFSSCWGFSLAANLFPNL